MNIATKNITRHFLCLTAAILLAAFSASAQHADFSGTWKLNPEKSEYPTLTLANLFEKMIIKQTDKQLTVGTLSGDKERTAVYNLDGTPVKSRVETPPARDRVSYFKWLGDRSYELNLIDDTGNEVYTTKSVITLSADGKILTMNSDVDYKQYGTHKMKLIIEKQQ